MDSITNIDTKRKFRTAYHYQVWFTYSPGADAMIGELDADTVEQAFRLAYLEYGPTVRIAQEANVGRLRRR